MTRGLGYSPAASEPNCAENACQQLDISERSKAPDIGSRIRALHATTRERGRQSGAMSTDRNTPAENLELAGGASATFRLFDLIPDGTFIDIHGGNAAEDRVRAAVKPFATGKESERREASSARPQAAQLDSRGATFPPSSSNPYTATGSEKTEGEKPAHLLASTAGRYELRHGVASMLRPDDGGRGPSVCGCGISGHHVENVRIHQNEKARAYASGVFRCDSAVLCPVCSVKRSMEIQERLTLAVQACIEKGGSVWFLTPTVRRKLDQDLAKLRTGFQAAYREARQGRAWVDTAESSRFLGITNVIESPWSPFTGWGLHGHSLIFFGSPFEDTKAERLAELYARAEWVAARLSLSARSAEKTRLVRHPRTGRSAGRGRVSRHSQTARSAGRAYFSWHPAPVRPAEKASLSRLSLLPDRITADAVFSDYVDLQWMEEHEFTEGAQRPLCDLLMERFLGRLPKHGLSGTVDAQGVEMVRTADGAAKYLGKIASEVAHGWVKEGRKAKSTSVHPFALAARGSIRSADGEPMEIPGLENVTRSRAKTLWQEYAAAMKGIRLGIITAKLAENLGIEPAEDEETEGDQEFLEEGHIGDVPAKMWNFLIRRCLAGTMLARVENEIDPTDADDDRRDHFLEIRDSYLDSWLDTGDEQAQLYARLWRCTADDVDEEGDEFDGDASYLSADPIPVAVQARMARERIERRNLASAAKRLRSLDGGGSSRPHLLRTLRDARLEAIEKARRAADFRKIRIAIAVARVHAYGGTGTLDRIRRVVADLAVENPLVRPLNEMEVLRACQAEERRAEAAFAATPQPTGDFADDIGDTF